MSRRGARRERQGPLSPRLGASFGLRDGSSATSARFGTLRQADGKRALSMHASCFELVIFEVEKRSPQAGSSWAMVHLNIVAATGILQQKDVKAPKTNVSPAKKNKTHAQLDIRRLPRAPEVD